MELPKDALTAVPIFPLPGTVLLPGTYLSLHVFEPRYRAMMEYVIEGHRLLVVALVDEAGTPDAHGRPPIHRVAGLGALRRAVRMPDGRYDLVLEGIGRVDVTDEMGPELVFRRAHGTLLEEVESPAPARLAPAMVSVRALCHRALLQAGDADPDVLESLSSVGDPGRLADLVAAAAFKEPAVRQQVLTETSVEARLELVAGTLGAQVLRAEDPDDLPEAYGGWGITPGKA